MDTQYRQRIDLCSKAVSKAVKKLKLDWRFAEDYQGIEISLDTKADQSLVIILLDVGHGPRYPKQITFTIHGYINHQVEKRVVVSGAGIGKVKLKFLPDQISPKTLHESIARIVEKTKSAASTENLDRLKIKALEKRLEELKKSPISRHSTTYLNI